MAKNTVKKIKELKSEKPEKITNDQLKRVQGIIHDTNRFQMEIGTIETRKHSVLHTIAGLNDQLTLMKDEFEREYGTTNINIETGEIKHNEQTN
tara:strand:- start:194 stop:475 length:282 start_codon:yes stop_codon:yes gene_type:complete